VVLWEYLATLGALNILYTEPEDTVQERTPPLVAQNRLTAFHKALRKAGYGLQRRS